MPSVPSNKINFSNLSFGEVKTTKWGRKIPIYYASNGECCPFEVELERCASFGVQRNKFGNMILKLAPSHIDVKILENIRVSVIGHLKNTKIPDFVFDGKLKSPVYGEFSKRLDPQLNEDKESKRVYTRFYDKENKWKLPLKDVKEKKFDAQAVLTFMSVWLKKDGSASLTIRAKKVFVWWNELDSEDEYIDKPDSPIRKRKRKKRSKSSDDDSLESSEEE